MKTCCTCKQIKELIAFGKDKHTKDGKNKICKMCLLKKRKETFYQYEENGQRECSCCGIVKKHEFFVKNKKRPNGIHVYCKDCSNKKLREYRKKNPTIWELQKNRNFKKWREKLGIPESEVPRRRKNGEGYISREGYLSYKIKDHPCADKNGRVQASHLEIYKHLGRRLFKGETVHHKNGDRLDNRIENLELWSHAQPYGQRIEDKISWCIEFLTQYGYEVKEPKTPFPL